jgi:ribosome maturation factor RimP
MDRELIIEKVAAIAGRVSGGLGIELVHIDIAGTKRDLVVRIYIDKDGGVTLDDCSRVSRGVEEVLDTEDIIPTRYVFEVSSPGIERELYSLADFVKFTGRLAKVKLKDAIGGQKTLIGTIAEVSGETIVIEDRANDRVSISYPHVEKANLKIDLAKEFGR